MELIKISELSKVTDVSIHTVRNYISEHLIVCCNHTKCGYALFDNEAIERLKFIRASRLAGLMLADIKPLISAMNNNSKFSHLINGLETKIDNNISNLNTIKSIIKQLKIS
jgi:MerR family mercuric resistance operon transcriptional regulator